MFNEIPKNINLFEIQESILKFWKENKIFEKSIQSRPESNQYSFYDGPPFITGSPHYGTLLSSIAKDVIPRYQTMRGKRVRRVWGWDCHGLPAETKVERQLGIKSKKEIETLGIGKFIAACKEYVKETSSEWTWYIDHIGRWVDMEHAYKTMDLSFMETVMWAFKQIYEKGLIYKGLRSSLYCTRCATPLSKFEITMDDGFYRPKTDPAITIKFKAKNKINTFFIAWTTTPWTLPTNFALSVNKDEIYVETKSGEETLILAEKALSRYPNLNIIKKIKGKDLLGEEYAPLFSFYKAGPNDHKIYHADFVTMEDGTGIVHVSPAFGEADMDLGKEKGLSLSVSLDEEGKFEKEVTPWTGMFYSKTNPEIIENLKQRNLLLDEKTITHSYPHCYRCETPMIYKGQVAWYLNIQKIKKDLIKKNKKVNWIPTHFKEGRFKNILETAPDWCLSRTRYWGSPIPVWECERCDEREVFGSISELEDRSGKKITDLHRPEIDEIFFPCKKCDSKMIRVKEVLDCWMESGAMPYAEYHYPFENKKEFEQRFPTDFISEYSAQIRAWFYYLHVLGVALKNSHVFKNVVVSGVLQGSDGRKMSKSLGNYPDPKTTLMKYGGEALRLYLVGSVIMNGEDVNITEEDIAEQYRKVMLILWNSYSYFITYANVHNFTSDDKQKSSTNILDLWIETRLEETIKTITERLDSYDHSKATKVIRPFIEDLSTWYIRRSRNRFVEGDKDALETLYRVLVKTSVILAPFTPFTSEHIYQNLVQKNDKSTKESIHLCDWPKTDEKTIRRGQKIVNEMEKARKIAYLFHSLRKEHNIPVKQPLLTEEVKGLELSKEVTQILEKEVNVRKTVFVKKLSRGESWLQKEEKEIGLAVNTTETKELEEEGLERELIRAIQAFRKEKGLKVGEKVSLTYFTDDTKITNLIFNKKENIIKTTLLNSFKNSASKDSLTEVISQKFWLKIT